MTATDPLYRSGVGKATHGMGVHRTMENRHSRAHRDGMAPSDAMDAGVPILEALRDDEFGAVRARGSGTTFDGVAPRADLARWGPAAVRSIDRGRRDEGISGLPSSWTLMARCLTR